MSLRCWRREDYPNALAISAATGAQGEELKAKLMEFLASRVLRILYSFCRKPLPLALSRKGKV